MATSDKKRKLMQDRLYYLGALGIVLLAVAILDWEALTHHPDLGPDLGHIGETHDIPENEPVTNLTFVVFDTETTGLDPHLDRLLEVAAVKFKNGKLLGEKSWLVNPGRFIPKESSDIHHITEDMVRNQKPYPEIHQEFIDFIGDAVLVAHNAMFDVRVMNMEFQRAEVDFPNNVTIDSLKLFRTWYPELKQHKVATMVEHLKIEQDGALHRAGTDSIYVGKLLYESVMKRNPNMKLKELVAATKAHPFEPFAIDR